jgi:hypothetical protein
VHNELVCGETRTLWAPAIGSSALPLRFIQHQIDRHVPTFRIARVATAGVARAPGYGTVATCLAPDLGARTEGVIAWHPAVA